MPSSAETQALLTCTYPGCEKKRYVDPTGKMHDYCSRKHKKRHKEEKEGQKIEVVQGSSAQKGSSHKGKKKRYLRQQSCQHYSTFITFEQAYCTVFRM